MVAGAYLACGGIGIGSFGPWGAEFFGYGGVGNNGSLTLLGAGLAALAVWRWTTSRRQCAAVAALGLGVLCVAVAIHDMLGIRDTFASPDDWTWIEGVGWGLGLVLLSGIVLILLSTALYRRSRVANCPSLNWKQRALIAAIGVVFIVGLASVVSGQPVRSDAEVLFLEGPGSQLDARDADDAVLALRPGAPAESVMERLGPPVLVHILEDESTFYYATWQLTFTRNGLRDRLKYSLRGADLAVPALDRRHRVFDRKIRDLRPGTSIEVVKAELGRPEGVEVYGNSLERDVGLWYGEWRLDFSGRKLKGRYR